MCRNWFSPTKGTPDYFYGCDNLQSGQTKTDYGVPAHDWFTTNCEDPSYPSIAYPANTRAYAGLEMIDNASVNPRKREYVTQQLPQPLTPGYYEIAFLVRSSDLPGEGLVESFGCLLTVNAPTFSNTEDLNDGALSTTIGDYAEEIKSGGWSASHTWETVRVKVLVTGSTKNYLTIGSFKHDISPVSGHTYYMIDNVQPCDPCDISINATRTSGDPDKCCYDITFTAGSNFCPSLGGFRIKNASTGDVLNDTYQTTDIFGASEDVFTVCLDRFTSGEVLFEMLDHSGAPVCLRRVHLECNCSCSINVVPSGFSVNLQRTPASPECCWNIVVANNSPCDMLLRGVVISSSLPPGAYMTASSGYVVYPTTPPPSTYISKSNTNNGDNYAAGSSTIIGTICLPQNTLDVFVAIDLLKSINELGQQTTCGPSFQSTLSCADQCCNQVSSVTTMRVASADSLKCCFDLNITMVSDQTCITKVTLQAKNSEGVWVDETSTSVSTNFSIRQCITLGTTKEIRLLFKNTDVVCIKELTLACEDDCCSAVENFHAFMATSNPCCYRITGDVQWNPTCPIANYVVAEFNSGTNMWVSIGGVNYPAPDGHFETLVCISSSLGMVRIQFRDGSNNVVCTRWLEVYCGPRKLGTGEVGGEPQFGLYAAPNPATSQTGIYYTLQKPGDVRISLYNMTGNLVAEEQVDNVSTGQHSTMFSTAGLAAGVYIVQLTVDGSVASIPLTITK